MVAPIDGDSERTCKACEALTPSLPLSGPGSEGRAQGHSLCHSPCGFPSIFQRSEEEARHGTSISEKKT